MSENDFTCFEVGDLLIRTAPLGPIATNCYVIGCRRSGQGAVIDSCAEMGRIQRMGERAPGLQITHLLQTHAHIDHVLALEEARDHYQAPIYVHRDEMPVYDSVPMQGMMFFGQQVPALPAPDKFVAHGDKIQIGELEAEVFLTPGHTPGSVCYYFKEQGVLFSGDVLFMGSIGRTDLPGGDMSAMRRSLALLKTFPDATRVFCGHGPDTTLGQEKQSNPFL